MGPSTRVVTAFASAARIATPTAKRFPTHGARELVVVIDVTAVTATPSVVFTIHGVDPVSAKTYVILASAAVATVSTVVLRVSAQLTASANLIAKDILPAMLEIAPVHGDADSITYTVAAHLIP